MFTYNVKWYGNVDTTISGSGNLTPVSQQTMAVEQPVTVTAVNYAAGDNVEEGTVIATAEDAQGGSIDYTAPYDCVLLELPVSSGMSWKLAARWLWSWEQRASPWASLWTSRIFPP